MYPLLHDLLLSIVPQTPQGQMLERKLDEGLLRRLATARNGEFLPVDIVLREQVPQSRMHAFLPELAANVGGRCGPVTWQTAEPYLDHPFPPGLTKPDVMAPGDLTISHFRCSGYWTDSGTSMSTPHVAGVAALLLQADPGLDHFALKALLEETALDLGAPGKDNLYGSGRVDAYAAARRALSNPLRR